MPESRARRQLAAGMLVAALATLKLLLHLYAGRYYGYFVDELYNLALARHLAWGYVDVAPMIALIGRIEVTLFGDSLSAIRVAPALAGAALVLLTGAMARELGGRRFAQGLAALCVLLAPGILAMDHFLNVNAFELLCPDGAAYNTMCSLPAGLAPIAVRTAKWVAIWSLAMVGLTARVARRQGRCERQGGNWHHGANGGIEGGYEEIVGALLDANADMNAKEDHGVTALQLAKASGRSKVVLLLRRAGARR